MSLQGSLKHLNNAGISADVVIETGNCHVDDCRNAMVCYFLKSDCSELVFIDADQAWTPDVLLKLLSHDVDIVGGVPPSKKDNAKYPVLTFPGPIYSVNGLVEVVGTGTGFLKISRKCIERMVEKSDSHLWGDDTHYVLFERLIVNGKRMSGDYAFCHKWREMGGKVYVDPSLILSHQGEKTWTGSLVEHWQHKLSMQPEIEAIRNGAETLDTFRSLTEKWGNPAWSASPEMLMACAESARDAKTAMECGTGLTTIVMAAAGAKVYALEDSREWAERVNAVLEANGLEANIYCAPLHYDITIDCNWYKLPRDFPESFDLAVVDGPRRDKGDREGVYQKFQGKIGKMIVDDLRDPRQKSLLSMWNKPITDFGRFAVA